MGFNPADPANKPVYGATSESPSDADPSAAAPATKFNPLDPNNSLVGQSAPSSELVRARSLVQSMPESAPFSFTPDREQVGMGRALVSGVRQVLDLSKNLEHRAPQALQNLVGHTPDNLYEQWKKGPLQMGEESDRALREDPSAEFGSEQASLLPWLIGGGPVAGGVRGLIPKAMAKAIPKTATTLVGGGTGAVLANATDPNNAGMSPTLGGFFGGALIPGAAGIGAAIAKPLRPVLSTAMQRAVGAMDSAGIPVDAMQRYGSRAGDLVRRYLTDSPGGSGVMKDAGHQRTAAYTASQLQQAGETTPTVHVEQMLSRLGSGLDNVAARANVKVDQPFLNDLASMDQDAEQITTNPASLRANISKLINSAATNSTSPGTIPGNIIQETRSNLAGLAKEGNSGAAALNDLMTSHFDRQVAGTPLADEWGALRQQYKNAKIIQKATTNDMEGQLRPSIVSSQLNNRYNIKRNTPDSTDPFVQTARGFKQLEDKYPNSGTAHRVGLQNVGRHAGAALLGGIGGAAASNSDHRIEGGFEGAMALESALLGSQYLGAKAINSPGFSRYMLGQTQSVPVRALQGAAQIPAYLSALYPEFATPVGNQIMSKKDSSNNDANTSEN